MTIILASGSPRRAELLRQAGIDFRIDVPAIKERIPRNLDPVAAVRELALAKGRSVARRYSVGCILAADTVVLYQKELLGKPADLDDARRMLSLLGGRQHRVLTGMALLNLFSGEVYTGLAESRVWLKRLSPNIIENYLATGEPQDKAGAYGIQGRAALFVNKIEGCYSNVVGLPLGLLFDLMEQAKIPAWWKGEGGDRSRQPDYDPRFTS